MSVRSSKGDKMMYKDLKRIFKEREIIRESVVMYKAYKNVGANDIKQLEAYNTYLKMIQTFHKGLSGITYHVLEVLEKPNEPYRSRKYEILHKKRVDDFKPSLFQKVFKKDSEKLKQLKDELCLAKEKDERQYYSDYQQFNDNMKNYEELLDHYKRIQGKDENTLKYWLEMNQPYKELEKMGMTINYELEKDTLEISILHENKNIVPMYEKLMVDNKVVTRRLSDSRITEIFKNMMISASVRAARESFESVPVKKVIIKSYYSDNNEAVMAVAYKKEIFERLDFTIENPNKIVELFNCRSRFDILNDI